MGLRLVLELPDVFCLSCKTKAKATPVEYLGTDGMVTFGTPAGWAQVRFEHSIAPPLWERCVAFICSKCVPLAQWPRAMIVQTDPT